MVEITTTIKSHNERGGGLIAAAFFWSVLIIVAIIVLSASYLFLGTRDTLLNLVPNDVIIYAHAQGSPVSFIQKIDPALKNLHPVEAAAFAVSEKEGLHWQVLLRWGRLLEATEEEQKMLEQSGAQKIADRTYLLGTVEQLALKEAKSLADDKIISRALASMRSVARIQAYLKLDPTTDLISEQIAESEQNSTDSSFVIAVNNLNNLDQIRLLTTDIRTASASRSFRIPATSRQLSELPILRPPIGLSSSRSFSLSDPTINLMGILMSDIETKRILYGVPESDELLLAKQNLKDLLAEKMSLTIEDGLNTDNQIRFSLYLPEIEPNKLGAAISKLFDASLPDISIFERPDGQKEREFILNPGQYAYSRIAQSEIQYIKIMESPGLIYPIKGFGTGVIIASDTEMLLSGENSLIDKTRQKGCLPGAKNTISLQNTDILSDKLPFLRLFLNEKQLKNLIIQQFVDKLVVFCG